MEDRELQTQILQNFVANYKKGFASQSYMMRQETGFIRGPSFSPTAGEMSDNEGLLKSKDNKVVKEADTVSESDDSDLDDDSASDLDQSQR